MDQTNESKGTEAVEAVTPVPMDEQQARTYAMFCHIVALVSWLGVPFGNIIGPLVLWLIKKDDHPFIDEQGRESLNFQINVTLAKIVSGLLCIILIGLPMLLVVVVAGFILTIVGAVRAASGEHYRYPVGIRFIP